MKPLVRRTHGYTLIELLTVAVLLAILAAIALPMFRDTVHNARAANILGDVRVVQIAYSNLLADNPTWTRNGGWGRVPPDLAPYLPEGFNFQTEMAVYRWVRLRPRASPWGVGSAMLWVRPVRNLRPRLVDKLARMANQTMIIKRRNDVRFYMVP
ncbi:MAG: prepilin-type N-terminal cleavage/methylation domain-containing protein [Gemmatimonadetes bacterium]|nr:prepilin-type N-terminal cleavage/methylation domain-containing protein [Gemmatimonadota bacterium]NNM07122.1 prepilin-type N-terminal cleavage/methylation domain-containing protein [Gemmatimonadota bacterium]